MIEIYNTVCRINRRYKSYIDVLSDYLVIREVESGKSKRKKEVFHKLYTMDHDGNMYYPRGLNRFIPPRFIREDRSTDLLKIDWSGFDFNELASTTKPGITLRDDQIMAIKKMAIAKRGIIQLPTGVGKTLIACGLIKSLFSKLGYYPKTLILEPTLILVNNMTSELLSCNIPCTSYTELRKSGMNIDDYEGIIVAHPKSLNSDLNSNNTDLLNSITVIIGDEMHHESCSTWMNVSLSSKNLVYNVGLSASAIPKEKLALKSLFAFTYQEAVLIGMVDRILLDIPASYYIEHHILATPIMIRLYNPANEYVKDPYDWVQLRKFKLESDNRARLAASSASYLASLKYKSLILAGTKKHSFDILKMISDLGFGDLTRCTFGGGVFYKYSSELGKPVQDLSGSTMDDYKSGKLLIFIGTSHIYEGADIPSLDAVILSSVGKSFRRFIQSVGRSLRITKHGKYAYIIDFTDSNDYILSKHSSIRRESCHNILGVPSNNIHDDVEFSEFKKLFVRLESL